MAPTGGFLGGGRSSGGLRVCAREEWGGDGASASQRRGKGARVGEERGWRPVSGRRRAQARTRGGSGPLKRTKGEEGGGLGGRWCTALMAGRGQRLRQRHGRARWVPRRRRGVSSSSCRLWRARRLSGTRQARRDGGGGGQRRACGQGAHGQAASGRAVAQRAHAGRA